MSNGIYIYGIVEKGEKNRNNFGAVGINSSEIYTIPYKDIEAVVSNVSGTAPLNIE
ncbi:MAG: GvpL/GvpF family gas vesicle protein, partial [Candidatus Thermoplasmatota archaeon]